MHAHFNQKATSYAPVGENEIELPNPRGHFFTGGVASVFNVCWLVLCATLKHFIEKRNSVT